MDYRKHNLIAVILLTVLAAVIGLFTWIFGMRDMVDSNRVRVVIEKLAPDEVSSIFFGHHSIQSRDSIKSIVAALNSSIPLSSASNARGVVMTVNLKSGKKMRCWVMQYLDHPGVAVLDFAYYPGSTRQVQFSVNQFVDILYKAGVQLPQGKNPTLSKEGTITNGASNIAASSRKTMPYTLYDINKSNVLAGSKFKIGYIVASIVLSCLALLYGLVGWRRYAKTKKWNLLGSGLAVCLILGYLGWAFGSRAYIFKQDWQRYQDLRTLLRTGKCETLCGQLTKVQYVYGSQGAIYPRTIVINGHEFVFSNGVFAQEFYDEDSWKDLAVDQLQLGRQACIWYSTIQEWKNPPEQIARVDVQ